MDPCVDPCVKWTFNHVSMLIVENSTEVHTKQTCYITWLILFWLYTQ